MIVVGFLKSDLNRSWGCTQRVLHELATDQRGYAIELSGTALGLPYNHSRKIRWCLKYKKFFCVSIFNKEPSYKSMYHT